MKISLKGLRANYDLSAVEVARAIGIHHQTLLKYENDSNRIPLDLLRKIAKYYNVPIDDIFLGRKCDLKRIYWWRIYILNLKFIWQNLKEKGDKR